MREGTIWAGPVSNAGIVDTGAGGPGGRKFGEVHARIDIGGVSGGPILIILVLTPYFATCI